MAYQVKFGSKAKKFLKNLDNNISLRIIERIEKINENPFRYLEHYEGEGFKLRIGDYRCLIDVDFKDMVLIVRVIDKRGKIYK